MVLRNQNAYYMLVKIHQEDKTLHKLNLIDI